jgi:hypothetical protein
MAKRKRTNNDGAEEGVMEKYIVYFKIKNSHLSKNK